jgi:hypothetical protein
MAGRSLWPPTPNYLPITASLARWLLLLPRLFGSLLLSCFLLSLNFASLMVGWLVAWFVALVFEFCRRHVMAMKDKGRRSEECKKGGRECDVLGMYLI